MGYIYLIKVSFTFLEDLCLVVDAEPGTVPRHSMSLPLLLPPPPLPPPLRLLLSQVFWLLLL